MNISGEIKIELTNALLFSTIDLKINQKNSKFGVSYKRLVKVYEY